MNTGTHLILSARQNLCIKLDSKYCYVQKQLKNSILLQYIQYLVLMKFQFFWVLFTGLCGNARLADVGGPGFLLPLPQKDKVSIQY